MNHILPNYEEGEEYTLDQLQLIFKHACDKRDFMDVYSEVAILHTNTTFNSSNIPLEVRKVDMTDEEMKRAKMNIYLRYVGSEYKKKE